MPELRVVRETDRFDECVAFYATTLCAPLVQEWEDHGRGRIYSLAGTGMIEVLEVPSATAVAGVAVSAEVTLDELTALHERLSASSAGVSAPADQPWGHRSFSVEDPSGLPLTFFAVLPSTTAGGVIDHDAWAAAQHDPVPEAVAEITNVEAGEASS